jgi:hypothetical protein
MKQSFESENDLYPPTAQAKWPRFRLIVLFRFVLSHLKETFLQYNHWRCHCVRIVALMSWVGTHASAHSRSLSLEILDRDNIWTTERAFLYCFYSWVIVGQLWLESLARKKKGSVWAIQPPLLRILLWFAQVASILTPHDPLQIINELNQFPSRSPLESERWIKRNCRNTMSGKRL